MAIANFIFGLSKANKFDNNYRLYLQSFYHKCQFN